MALCGFLEGDALQRVLAGGQLRLKFWRTLDHLDQVFTSQGVLLIDAFLFCKLDVTISTVEIDYVLLFEFYIALVSCN